MTWFYNLYASVLPPACRSVTTVGSLRFTTMPTMASSGSHKSHSPRSHHVLGRSCSSIGSGGSLGTVQHHRKRSVSGSSLSSLSSLWMPQFRRHDENTTSRSSSSHNLTLGRRSTRSDRCSASGSCSRRTSFASVLSSRRRSEPPSGSDLNETRLLDVAESDGEVPEFSEEVVGGSEFGDRQMHIDLSHQEGPDPVYELAGADVVPEKSPRSPESPRLRRWISTLRRRKQQMPPVVTPRLQRWTLDDFESRPSSPIRPHPSQHKHSGSNSSSIRFITAVRSATATLASVSIATMSRRNSRWRRGQQRSSVVSGSEHRPSMDSYRSMIDEAAKQRSRKRREKLEELIRTEESYVADVKALANVSFQIYLTFG